MNLCMLRTLVGTSISLISFMLENRGLTSLFITKKPRYSVYVFSNNDFYEFALILLHQFFVEIYLMHLDGTLTHFDSLLVHHICTHIPFWSLRK